MQRLRVTVKLTLLAALLSTAPSVLLVLNSNNGVNQLWLAAQAFVFSFLLNVVTIGLLFRQNRSVPNTGKAVPGRIKSTLDTISGGVAILDPIGRMTMVNDAFLQYMQCTREQLIGHPLEVIPFRTRDTEAPWETALKRRKKCSGVSVELELGLGLCKTFVVNASPISGSRNELAGALISFEDVTTLETQKRSLMVAMAELQTSKEQIHQQNLQLQELASKDALTGCFNRRVLMEYLESKWIGVLKQEGTVSVVMLDVDHFKKLNDTYGHSVGDEVLKEVATVLNESVNDAGLVGRFGGEEFCIILSDMPVQSATEIAEGVRRSIQHRLAEPYKVTASFGISSSARGGTSCQAMLEQADQALYAAKQGGRNQVRLWSATMEGENLSNTESITQSSVSVVRQSISYQAVAALHSALAYRDADTALHSQRVSELCVVLGRGFMSISELYILEIAGLLHDIGKIGVPDMVLLRPGRLNREQWKVMEAHARMGVEIVESSFQCQDLTDIVRLHHCRYDGSDSPPGLPIGTDIPLGARIVSIADAYDAMVSNRVYRKGRTMEEAFRELERCAGSQFDPDLVKRFVSLRVGWRPDSRYLQSDVEDSFAISVGHLTERTVSAFEARDVKTLAESLDRLKGVARQLNHMAIVQLTDELSKSIAGREVDWDLIVPTLQNLLEICLTIQRAHIREVASRPQSTLDCPQMEYYRQARQWETVNIDSDPSH